MTMTRLSKLSHALLGALALAGCSPPTDTFRPASELFAPRLDLMAGASPKAVAIVDIDNDGKKDIVVARATGSGAITLLIGHGDGSFSRLDATNGAGDTPWGLAVADFDKD